jgi:5-methylcytosine-specific restriction endonuclease McrA
MTTQRRPRGGIETAATRAARRDRERSTAGWSWETNARRREQLTAQCLATYGDVCHLCRTDGADSADHLIPRSAGGLNELGNLRPAHRGCNTARGTMPLEQWFRLHPTPHREALPPSREW